MTTKKMTPEQEFKTKLNKLRKDLRGKQTAAARHLELDPSYINHILAGRRDNLEVLNKLVEFRDKVKKEKNDLFRKFVNEA